MDSENHNSYFFGFFSSFLGQQDGHFGPTTCMKQALGAPVQAPRPAAPSDSTLPQFINQYSSNSNIGLIRLSDSKCDVIDFASSCPKDVNGG